MDHTEENEDDDRDNTIRNNLFFIEDCSSSGGEEDINFGYHRQQKNGKEAPKLIGESSPPLLLAFSTTSGKHLQDTRSTSSDDLHEEPEGDSDQTIEEWMILGGEEQVEDSSIQLNLSYWSSSEDDTGYEDMRNDIVNSVTDTWAVSDKDKYGANQSLASRYFVPGRSLICHICNRMGHVAKNCHLHKRNPICVLCGTQGHTQRDCPGRPCSNCGLSSHSPGPCKGPPVWNQHCQRCGMTGHLSDACPDTWRQYHLTIRLEVPLRPRTTYSLKHKSLRAHCYNCSKRGHYGYECRRTRMVSGTFPSLPYVCHYDTMDDILHHSRIQTGSEALESVGSFPNSDHEHFCEKTGERSEEKLSVHRSSKQEASSRVGRRKTWPERRRERREVKRQRREAQAMRGGGLLGRCCSNSDDEVCQTDPFRQSFHCCSQFIPSPEKKVRDGKAGGKTRKSREAERWKKRGGMKWGHLYPHGDVDIGSENLFSPKQRLRHKRR